MKDDMMGSEIRKGFLKMVVLKIISQKPIHGYDIMQEIEAKTMGLWVPSPGSVYPVLEYLETKGYISMEEADRKKVYTITESGKKTLDHIDQRRKELIEEMNMLFGD
jgi:DNA-binding PadR family transcriptional regulator